MRALILKAAVLTALVLGVTAADASRHPHDEDRLNDMRGDVAIHQCGRVLVSEVLGSLAERRMLEVEMGFSWERGVVLHDYYELLAEGEDLRSLLFRVRLLQVLKDDDRVCIWGTLVERPSNILAIIPDQIVVWAPLSGQFQRPLF